MIIKILQFGIKYLRDPKYRFLRNADIGIYNGMDDEKFLRIKYRYLMGKELNLDDPQTYNEKLQWLKLYDHNPLYTTMVDKYEAKKYVASLIGQKYIIPTLGVWNRFEEIEFDKLPNQFVLKCTHDSGGIVICRDKSQLDIKKAKKKIEKCLRKNYYYQGREWPYKNVKPRIIAEEYKEDSNSFDLKDYKFFCFDGVPKALFVATDRQSSSETKFDFFDAEFRHLDIRNGHPNSSTSIEKPKSFDEMLSLAAVLSKNIPHARIDFYEIDGKPYFGEITLSHWSGMVPFEPEEWDYKFGEWIKLPNKRN